MGILKCNICLKTLKCHPACPSRTPRHSPAWDSYWLGREDGKFCRNYDGKDPHRELGGDVQIEIETDPALRHLAFYF